MCASAATCHSPPPRLRLAQLPRRTYSHQSSAGDLSTAVYRGRLIHRLSPAALRLPRQTHPQAGLAADERNHRRTDGAYSITGNPREQRSGPRRAVTPAGHRRPWTTCTGPCADSHRLGHQTSPLHRVPARVSSAPPPSHLEVLLLGCRAEHLYSANERRRRTSRNGRLPSYCVGRMSPSSVAHVGSVRPAIGL